MEDELTMRVPVVTAVHGGRGVPLDEDDWEIVDYRDVRPVENGTRDARYFITAVDGPSLEAENILDGDLLLCRITHNYEVGRLGIWQTPNGRTAKYAYYEDGFVVLHNDNGWRQEWAFGDVRLLGVVERVERDLQPKW